MCLTAFSIFYCLQLVLNIGTGRINLFGLVLNTFCVLILFGAAFFISLNVRLSLFIAGVIAMLMGTADYFIVEFRGNELQPADLLSVGTALNVAGSYELTLYSTMFYAWALFLIVMLGTFAVKNVQLHGWKCRGVVLLGVVLLSVSVALGGTQFKDQHWQMKGSRYNGFLLNFSKQIKDVVILEPDHYSLEVIADYEEDYTNAALEEDTVLPTVIIIMDESFADFTVIGDLNTNIEVTPFLDSLTENTVRGYALSSVFGGGTANSEYEMLSGNSMAFLPTGSIVYQQYISTEVSTLVSYMKRLGYSTFATHPYNPSGWMRTTVYPLLSFDGYSFIDSYPKQNLLREYVSDQEMFEYIIAQYEARDTDTPFFLFGVTMQNHGGYTYEGENYEQTITLEGYTGSYPRAEQYLSLIHETDAAMEYLIGYFQSVEEPVVILFYGDHLPSLEEDFYTELYGGSFSTLDEQQLQYTVPFLIWANYDIEEQEVALTSLNYLSTYLMDAAGLPKTAYQTFLTDLEDAIPAINSQGYYSLSAGGFLPISSAEGEEEALLLKYWQLQYNGMFDTENSSAVFFP